MKPLKDSLDFDDLIRQRCLAEVRKYEGGDTARVTRQVVQKPLADFNAVIKLATDIAFDSITGAAEVKRFREIVREKETGNLLRTARRDQLDAELADLGYDMKRYRFTREYTKVQGK